MQAVSIPTMYGWYNRWKEAGIEGLATKPRSGRPPKTGEEYLQSLKEILEKEPEEMLVKGLELELAPIRVNAIAPGIN